MRSVSNILTIALLLTTTHAAEPAPPLVAKGAQLTLLAGDFKFTEGPAVDAAGDIYFTDQPNDRILKWNVNEKKLSTFMQPCGRANGLFFDPQGRLLACADEANELWRITMADKSVEKLVTNLNGKRLNGPNDVWVRPDGGLYFTDPFYKRDYWKGRDGQEQPGQYVYYLAPGAKTPKAVITDFETPNGIVGKPNETNLYVADIKAGKTWVYDYTEDGSLSGKRLIAPMGSDGMTVDSDGNLYLTGKGVTIYNQTGEKVGHIDVDEGWTANVCFGGTDRKTLFITAMDSLYSIEMTVPGLKP